MIDQVAKGPRKFLSWIDQANADGVAQAGDVLIVSIDPRASPLELIELAQMRLQRERDMLLSLSCLPTVAQVQVATMAGWLLSPLDEINNLLSAASDGMGAKKGGAS